MATVIRPELSVKNKYWIEKHRYYELKHFCLQYTDWKKKYSELDTKLVSTSVIGFVSGNGIPSDLTSKYAVEKAYYSNRIKLIEESAVKTDEVLYAYILKAVTEGLSYSCLKTKFSIPCGKDMYYDRFRKFFWILNSMRG